MTDMARIRVTWNGIGGLPGLSTFYVDNATLTSVTALVGFFNSIKPFCPNALTWTIPGTGDVINDAAGILVGGWTATGGATVTGSGGTGAYVAGTGIRVRWSTNAIQNGRRVRGSTFVCPIMAAQYDTNGTPADAMRGTLQTAAATLFGSLPLRIWHRSTAGANAGFSSLVTAADIPDNVSWLRSRRT